MVRHQDSTPRRGRLRSAPSKIAHRRCRVGDSSEHRDGAIGCGNAFYQAAIRADRLRCESRTAHEQRDIDDTKHGKGTFRRNPDSIPLEAQGNSLGAILRTRTPSLAAMQSRPSPRWLPSGVCSASSHPAAVEVKRNQSFDVGWRFLRSSPSNGATSTTTDCV